MSQTTTNATAVADALESLADAREALESVDDADLSDLPDTMLVQLRGQLKELEDATEETRKKQAEQELRTRVEPGEKLLGLSRVESHNKYVIDDAASVVGRAVAEGVDYGEFVSINASKLADVAPDLAEIGESEYDYFR
jgi:hypothetical protein